MSRLYIKDAKDAGNLSVDLLFSDQTTRRVNTSSVVTRILSIINILTLVNFANSQ